MRQTFDVLFGSTILLAGLVAFETYAAPLYGLRGQFLVGDEVMIAFIAVEFVLAVCFVSIVSQLDVEPRDETEDDDGDGVDVSWIFTSLPWPAVLFLLAGLAHVAWAEWQAFAKISGEWPHDRAGNLFIAAVGLFNVACGLYCFFRTSSPRSEQGDQS